MSLMSAEGLSSVNFQINVFDGGVTFELTHTKTSELTSFIQRRCADVGISSLATKSGLCWEEEAVVLQFYSPV